MKNESVVKTRVTPHFRLVIDAEDGSPERVWRLCPTYKAIAAIEEATGLDLKKFEDWQNISSGKQFPKIVWGLLEKFNPEVTVEDVLEILNPEAQRELTDVIFDLLFPGAKEALEKLRKEKESGATASPNVETATPSV